MTAVLPCPTRWVANMDPWTLAYLAGHRDMAITRRYVHPQDETIRTAMDRVREPKPETTGKKNTASQAEERPQRESTTQAVVIN